MSPAEEEGAAELRKQAAKTQRSNTAPWRWQRRKMAIHLAAVRRALDGCHQLSMAADPSSYGGEETMVAKVYSWEKRVAASPNIKCIRQTKYVTPDDALALGAAERAVRSCTLSAQ